MSSNPYVVLIGDIGVGKSTLVEKLTRWRNLSSDSSKSFTKHARLFHSRRLQICDTPGSNPMEERFEHNVWIAKVKIGKNTFGSNRRQTECTVNQNHLHFSIITLKRNNRRQRHWTTNKKYPESNA